MGMILVIDDEDMMRATLREALEAAGHEVLEASDGETGMHICQKQPVDLVITDILMPKKEGLECILEIRRLNPALPVIVISGGMRFDAMDVLDLAKRFGARRTFWKPFELASVVRAVQEELETPLHRVTARLAPAGKPGPLDPCPRVHLVHSDGLRAVSGSAGGAPGGSHSCCISRPAGRSSPSFECALFR